MKKFFRWTFTIIILLEIGGVFGLLPIAPDFTWVGLLTMVSFSWIALELFQVHFFVWLLVLIAIILDSISSLLGLYSLVSPWDKLVHIWGGIVVSSGVLELILSALKRGYVRVQKQNLFIIVSVFLTVTFLGFLYEFFEYLVDHFQYGYPKSLVSAYNSIEDQLFNLLGAILVLCVYYLWKTFKEKIRSKIN